MLLLTPEETAFVAKTEASADAVNALHNAIRNRERISYHTPSEERERIQAEYSAQDEKFASLRADHEALLKTAPAIKIALKNEFNAFIAKSIPGGEANALVEVANEILTALTTDTAVVGTAQLAKNLLVLAIDSFNDPEIHAARARGTYARYTALMNAGFPEHLASQLILAEAARALPMPNFSTGSKSR